MKHLSGCTYHSKILEYLRNITGKRNSQGGLYLIMGEDYQRFSGEQTVAQQ